MFCRRLYFLQATKPIGAEAGISMAIMVVGIIVAMIGLMCG